MLEDVSLYSRSDMAYAPQSAQPACSDDHFLQPLCPSLHIAEHALFFSHDLSHEAKPSLSIGNAKPGTAHSQLATTHPMKMMKWLC